jgi:Na+/H+-dicarboxylate symporter
VSLLWTGPGALGSPVISKKSLTYWILFAMVLGGEIGFDRPALAEHLRILSDIFLRLIKVLVAPLILGSLVTGIAGHGDFTLMLTTKGLAGVPRAMLVVLVATAATFHLSTEPIFLILGVDALIDMGRAALNVVGNCLASAVIARWKETSIAHRKH